MARSDGVEVKVVFSKEEHDKLVVEADKAFLDVGPWVRRKIMKSLKGGNSLW